MGRFAYQKGRRNELRSMAILEASGYRCFRSAGSHGLWDVIAIGTTDAVLLQIKTRDWPGTVEMELLKEFPVPACGCVRRLIHRWKPRQRLPDVKEL